MINSILPMEEIIFPGLGRPGKRIASIEGEINKVINIIKLKKKVF